MASSSTSVCGSASTSRASASCCAWAGVTGRPPGADLRRETLAGAPAPSRARRRHRARRAGRTRRRPGRASSRFSASVPTKTWCSWVTSTTCLRRSSSGRSTSGTPPTVTRPVRGGWMPASSRPSVDLPAPDGPDHGQPLARAQVEVDAVQHVVAVAVGEPHVGDLDVLVARRLVARLPVVRDELDAEDPGQGGGADLHLVQPRDQPVDRVDQLHGVQRHRGDLRRGWRGRWTTSQVPQIRQMRHRDGVGQLHRREPERAQPQGVALGAVRVGEVLLEQPDPPPAPAPAPRPCGHRRRSRRASR